MSGVSKLAIFGFAVSACSGNNSDIKQKVGSGIPPSLVANAPIVPVSSDPYSVPVSIRQSGNISSTVRVAKPNDSLVNYGFLEFSGNPDDPYSVYNILGPDGLPLDRFRESNYVIDRFGFWSFVNDEFKSAFVSDLRSDLEAELLRVSIPISNSTVNDLGYYVLRSLADGYGLDLELAFLSPDTADAGLNDYILFERTDINSALDIRVINLKRLPETYELLKRRIDEASDVAFE